MMVIGTILAFLLLALLILFFLKQLWTRRHLPPGPLALPLIGTFLGVGLSLREDYFRKPVKRYGNIYSLWNGQQLMIVLSGFKAVKEGMTNFPEEFSDRPDDPFWNDFGKGRGIVLSNGHNWKQQRHIGMTSLRKLGLGKKSIEHQIEEAAEMVVEIFRETKEDNLADMMTKPLAGVHHGKCIRSIGQPFDPSLSILNAVSNIICALSFGHQFSTEDEEFQKLAQALNIIFKFLGGNFHLVYHLFPQLMKHLPGPHKKALASVDIILAFAKQEIEKHKESQSLHEPQDFIDYYLFQMEKSRKDPDSTYNEENLAQCIFDFFAAGIETTFTTLMWSLLLLTNHPDIQEKVQKEIEDVFGSSGSISYQDRKKLPYTNAVIHEMLRVKYAFLYGLPRQSTKDVMMREYHIPKGTIIIADLRSVLLDPEQWETPEKFNPKHFLDKDGKFIDREEFLSFGIAERVCVGEQLARIEIFIFLTSLLRAFSFRLPEGVKELDEETAVKMIMHPAPYKLCAIPTQP